MKRAGWISLAILTGVLTFLAPSAATPIQFEGVVPDNGLRVPGTYYFEKGYNLTASGPHASANGIFGKDWFGNNSDGTAIFGWCNESAFNCQPVIKLSHWGAYFDFNAVDVSNLLAFDLAGSIPAGLEVVVTGHKKGGAIVTQSLPIVQDFWQTYPLIGFDDLIWVTITTNIQGIFAEGDVAMDNLDLTFVPEPGTFALVLGGLGLWAFRRRRHAGVAAG